MLRLSVRNIDADQEVLLLAGPDLAVMVVRGGVL